MVNLVEGEFARKYYASELRGFLTKEFQVPQGMAALLLEDEKLDRVVGPGIVTVASGLGQLLAEWFGSGRDKNSLVLLRAAEVKLPFYLTRVVSADPIFMDVNFNLTVKLKPGSEALFLSNILGSGISLSIEELKEKLQSEVKDVAQVYIKKRCISELADNFSESLKDMQAEMEAQLHQDLDASGLSFVKLEGLDFYCEEWDERTRAMAAIFSRVAVKEVALEERKRFFDLTSQEEVQAIAEETKKAEFYELRIQLWERVRRAAQTDKMNEVRSERDLENFIRELDRDKLFKEEDYEEIKRNLADKLEDRDRARAHLVRLAELKNESEYRRQEFTLHHALTADQQAAEAELEKSRLKAELDRLDVELEIQKKQGEIELSRARLDADKEGIKMSVEEQKLAQEREHEAALEKQRLEGKREEMRQEIEYYESLSHMPPEALVLAAPDAAKAGYLAELAKLKVQGGMTTEQILAMSAASGTSPQAAEMLKNLTSRANSLDSDELSERRIKEQKEFREEMQKSNNTFIDSYKDVFEKAMKTLADIAQSKGQGGPVYYPPPYPAYPPQWQTPPPAPGQIPCPKCRQPVPAQANFCPYCGEKRSW
ncbi:hypothetical protein ACFLWE_00635 [Chloroflexota bacterium]